MCMIQILPCITFYLFRSSQEKSWPTLTYFCRDMIKGWKFITPFFPKGYRFFINTVGIEYRNIYIYLLLDFKQANRKPEALMKLERNTKKLFEVSNWTTDYWYKNHLSGLSNTCIVNKFLSLKNKSFNKKSNLKVIDGGLS